MRTIRTKVYKFSELSKDAQFAAICNQIEFEIQTMDEDSPFLKIAEEMERMQTPWFLSEAIYHNDEYRQIIIDNIEANEYEFFANGKLIPATV